MALFVRDPVDREPRRIADLPADLPFHFQSFLMRAPETVKLLMDLLDRCTQAYRDIAGSAPKPKKQPDFAAECAMKCANQAFRRYLMECHELQDAGDTERVKTRVRSILAITSMAELNKDGNAATRWEALRNNFNDWMRA